MRILYVQPGHGTGGAKVSLYHLLHSTPESLISQVAISAPADREYLRMLNGHVEKVHQLWLPTWIKRPRRGFPRKILHSLSMLRRGWYLTPTLRLAKLIRRECIDLVHTNSIATPIGALAARFAKIPHIWHVRERVGSDGYFALSPGDWFSARFIDKMSHAIICNSQYTAGFFRSHGVQPEVIYNGIDLSRFMGSQGRGERLRAQLGLDIDCIVIAMVASIRSGVKEHDLFLQTAAILKEQHPECRFVVFGCSKDLDATSYTRMLRDLAAGLGLDGKMVWAGFIEDVPAIMHSFDIMIHPTSMEGSGRVVMEAMAAGKPVIGVRSGGVQELIQDGFTGYLVPPQDPVAIQTAVQILIENPALHKSIGDKAMFYARENFSLCKTQAEILKTYIKVTGKLNISFV